jgi:hypothetical protein
MSYRALIERHQLIWNLRQHQAVKEYGGLEVSVQVHTVAYLPQRVGWGETVVPTG